MKPFRLNRRALLRGMGLTGIAVALPVLDAMLDDKGLLYGVAGAQAQPTPVRLIMYWFPNGTLMDRWHPTGDGAGYTLSEILTPLAGHNLPDGTPVPNMVGDINVLTGLRNNAAAMGMSGAGHIRGQGSLMTGMPTGLTGATGPSVEQVAALAFGHATRFPSLPIGLSPEVTYGYENASASLSNDLSWSAPDQPVPSERDAQAFFARLFSSPSNADAAQVLVDKRQSVLDFVMDDWTRLSARVGQVDRARLDEHLTSIRELERQLTETGFACTPPAQPGVYGSIPGDEYARLMMRLLVTAMRCDLTRYSSCHMFQEGNLYPWLGPEWAGLERHGLSHRTDDEANRLNTIFSQHIVGQFAYFCSLLKSANEGTGSMLDNSLIFLSSDVSESSVHNYDDMPILLAGRGGGRVVPGRHLRYPDTPTFNNLFVSMLNYAGVPTTHFGLDGTGPLPQLEG